MRTAVDASPERPILIDKFLERAAEFDVDALADETAVCYCRDSGAHRRGRHPFRRFIAAFCRRFDCRLSIWRR